MAESISIRKTVRRFLDGYLAALGTKSPFGQLIQSAVNDEKLRRKFVAAPRQTLAEAGIALPDGLDVQVLENTDKVIHLVLPPLVQSDVSLRTWSDEDRPSGDADGDRALGRGQA